MGPNTRLTLAHSPSLHSLGGIKTHKIPENEGEHGSACRVQWRWHDRNEPKKIINLYGFISRKPDIMLEG